MYKFHGGAGAIVCDNCSIIIKTPALLHDEVRCRGFEVTISIKEMVRKLDESTDLCDKCNYKTKFYEKLENEVTSYNTFLNK